MRRHNPLTWMLLATTQLALSTGCGDDEAPPPDAASAPCGGAVVEVEGGSIEADETWSCNTRVLGEVSVENAATLTIAAGVTVTMAEDASLRIGESSEGSLLAQGTAEQPITFTVEPAAEAWGAIVLGAETVAGVIGHARIEYAASEGAALIIEEQEVSLSNLAISDGPGGVYLENGGTVATFDLISFANIEGAVVSADGEGIGSLSGAITAEADDYLEIRASEVRRDTLWAKHAELPYLVRGVVEVRGEDAPTLTIAGGTTLLFDPETYLRVGEEEQGSLVLDGASAAIVLDSSRSEPEPGDWSGVVVASEAVAASFSGVTFRHAGGHYSAPAFGWGTDAALIVDESEASIIGCTFENNAVRAIDFEYGGVATAFADNTFIANDGEPVAIGPTGATTLGGGGNSFEQGDRIYVTGGLVSEDGTLSDLGIPYRFAGHVLVEGDSAPTLTLAPGVELQFDEEGYLEVGADLQGALYADGSSEPIVLDSAKAVKGAGDWSAVALLERTVAANTLIRGVTFRNCGAHYSAPAFGWGADACLVVETVSPAIDGSTFEKSAGNGIELTYGAAPTMSDNTFSDIAGENVLID